MTKDAWAEALLLAVRDHEHGNSALLHTMASALAELDEATHVLMAKGYGEGYGRINFPQLADRLPERQ